MTKVFTCKDLKPKEIHIIAGLPMHFERFDEKGHPVWSHITAEHYIEYINVNFTKDTPIKSLK